MILFLSPCGLHICSMCTRCLSAVVHVLCELYFFFIFIILYCFFFWVGLVYIFFFFFLWAGEFNFISGSACCFFLFRGYCFVE